MCGICGKIYHNRDRKVDPALIVNMCRQLQHRGPDDEGIHVQGSIGLGHRRLSIIDLSSAGRQPMTNEDGTILLVFNGEIYNFPELRADLEKQGHHFASQTDTEVIVHLYEEKGTACLESLHGMFAFALWDSSRERLFLARDRLGQKPLVYAFDNECLLFASEIKALLADPGLSRTVDATALHHYLTYGCVPSPCTIFSSIRKLPPAHYMVCERGSVTIERYWHLAYRPKLSCSSFGEYKERFFDIFTKAVRQRLRCDVPFGAFLSGGVDSSIIVALMSRMLDTPVHTFSIGFEEEQYNELPFARTVADRYQTRHYEFVVRPDIVDTLPRLIRAYNEPFADSSAVPTYYLAKMTRQHVTVALSGDGGDESFAGYPRYAAAALAALCRTLAPPAQQRTVAKLLRLLPDGRRRHSFARRLKRYVQALYETPGRRYVRWLCHFDNDMKAELYSPAFRETVRETDSADMIEVLFSRAGAVALLDKTLYADVALYLPETLLVKTDIASMAHALEARCPFLDHNVMQFGAALPDKFKMRGFTTKFFLKQSLGDYLPRDILARKKMGFGVPIDRWLRNELKDMAYDILLDGTARQRGYFRPEAIQKLLDEHSAGLYNHCYRIWNLLCLELWHRVYADRGISAPPESLP